MDNIKCFIDSSVFIAWLRNDKPIYNHLEKIKKFIRAQKLEVFSSVDIQLEICKGYNGVSDWGKIKKEFQVKITPYLNPQFIINDTDGSVTRFLKKNNELWEVLKRTGLEEDAKHLITSSELSDIQYFLTLNKKHFMVLLKQARLKEKDRRIVTPAEFLGFLENSY